MPAILWIGNPASLRAVEDSVRPSLDVELVVQVYFEAVEEDDDLGRSDERALKVNADGGGGIAALPDQAHVFTGEEIQITGCESEHISDASEKLAIFPGDEAAVGPILCEELDRRLDVDRAVFVHI